MAGYLSHLDHAERIGTTYPLTRTICNYDDVYEHTYNIVAWACRLESQPALATQPVDDGDDLFFQLFGYTE